jgi:type III secretion protein T
MEEIARSRFAELAFTALILSAARPLAFVMVTPIFTRFGLQEGVIRGALLLAFAAPILPGTYAELSLAASPSLLEMALLLFKELSIGVLLAVLLGLPLWAIAAAGDIIDMQRGASMAELVDPGSGDQTTPTGTLFFLLAALLLVSNGWFTEVLLASLYDTYAIWPVLAPLPSLGPAMGAPVLGLLDRLLETAMLLAMPLFAALLLTEISLAIACKYVQQINVMFLAMGVKQIVYAVLLPVYFATLMFFVADHVRDLGGTMEVLRGFLPPPEAAR